MAKQKVISVRYYDRNGDEHHFGDPHSDDNPVKEGLMKDDALKFARYFCRKNGMYAAVVRTDYVYDKHGRLLKMKMKTLKGVKPR